MATRNKLWANIDWITIIIYILLVALGWLNIYSSVYNSDQNEIFDFSQRYGKQLIWIGFAIIIAFIVLLIETNFYVFFAYIIYGAVIFSLILVLLIGKEINYSKSWFMIGGFGIQPAEFGKFATAMALAKYMSSFSFKLERIQSFLVIGGIIMLPVLLILLQNDTGSALVYSAFILVLYREGMSGIILFFGSLLIILFISSLLLPEMILFSSIGGLALLMLLLSRVGIKHFISAVAIFIAALGLFLITENLNFIKTAPENLMASCMLLAGISLLIYARRKKLKYYISIAIIFICTISFAFTVDYAFDRLLSQYQQARIYELLGIKSDPLGVGYNVNQSKIAIGSGGLSGKGFLNGTQTKYSFVPEQSTDFIFCTVGEEWGFLGSSITIFLFLALFIRLIIIAEKQRSGFSRIYGYSVAVILFFHFMVNIGMTIGIMPVIGIPLPFFSYGGSSLWAFTLLLFIFIRLDASRLDSLSQ